MTKQVTINGTKVFKHEFNSKDVYALRNTDDKVNDVYLSLCDDYKHVELTNLKYETSIITYAEITCVKL